MLSDSGCYMCEINTEPQSTLFTVYLDVQKRPVASAAAARPEPASSAASVQSERSVEIVTSKANGKHKCEIFNIDHVQESHRSIKRPGLTFKLFWKRIKDENPLVLWHKSVE